MNQIIFLCYLTIMSICDNILSLNLARNTDLIEKVTPSNLYKYYKEE